jgi:hypothetical protein
MYPKPFYESECHTYHPMTKQAQEFFSGLDDRELQDLGVTAAILDTSERLGRPPGGRSERVAGSSEGLFELRITPACRRGPRTRGLYVREQRQLLFFRGLRKARRRLSHNEIGLADRDAAAHRLRREEGHDR